MTSYYTNKTIYNQENEDWEKLWRKDERFENVFLF
jgi:hypothetical protein